MKLYWSAKWSYYWFHKYLSTSVYLQFGHCLPQESNLATRTDFTTIITNHKVQRLHMTRNGAVVRLSLTAQGNTSSQINVKLEQDSSRRLASSSPGIDILPRLSSEVEQRFSQNQPNLPNPNFRNACLFENWYKLLLFLLLGSRWNIRFSFGSTRFI